MTIKDIIKDKQPEIYKKLKHKEEKLSFSEIKQLMKHDSYKRGKSGALKQKQ